MKKLKTQKRMKRLSAAILTLCFAAASAITSVAASEGVEDLYQKAYEASMVRTDEDAEEQELEEYTRVRDENMEIVETDDPVNLDARLLNSYTWELDGGVIYVTGIFWASKGDKIAVSATPSPTSAKVGIGLDQPDGVLRGVTGKGGPMSHTFTVTVTGFHRVYAENLEKKTISVVVGVSKD